MTDIQTYIIPLMLIAAIIYAVVMFIYRKIQKGEKFDANKILQTAGIGAIAGITLYLATGAIPSLDAILTEMANIAPNQPSLIGLGALVFGLFEQYILKGKLGTTPIIASPVPAAKSQNVALPPVEVNTYGKYKVGEFEVFVPYKDVGIDPSKYPVGSMDWQHACNNVQAAEGGYSALASASGKPTAANPLEKEALKAAAALAAFQGLSGKGVQNIKDDLQAVGA
jgi:hypothetical protein